MAKFDPGAGCATVASGLDPSPAAIATTQRIVCGSGTFDVKVAVFSPRSTAAPIMAERRRLSRLENVDDASEEWLSEGQRGEMPEWRIVKSNHSPLVVATAVWIDGKPVRPGMGIRLRMGIDSVLGGAAAPVVVGVALASVEGATPTASERRQSHAMLAEFLLSQTNIDEQMRLLARSVR